MKSFPFFHRLIWISDRDPLRLWVQNGPIYKLLKLSWLTAGVGRPCGADNVNFGPGSTNSLNKISNQSVTRIWSFIFFFKISFQIYFFPIWPEKYMYLSKEREILDRPLCLLYYLCLRSSWESLLRSAFFFYALKEHQVPSHVVSVQHTYSTKTHSFLYFPGVIVTCWICQYTIYTQKHLLNCYSFIKTKSKENLILWKLRVFVR